jgi:hypothetical protein
MQQRDSCNSLELPAQANFRELLLLNCVTKDEDNMIVDVLLFFYLRDAAAFSH